MSLKNHWMRLIRRHQRGFTLIEVLVTVIVLSIGLLGLAGLQAVALKFNSTAYQRSQATVLIYDMIEQMRAMRAQSDKGRLYDYLSCISGGACDPTVQADIQEWNNMISRNLPSGNLSVTRCDPNSATPCPANTYIFSIRWDDSRGQEALRTVEIRTNL